ncbi:YncE family protein [Pedobacter sp. SD-b]|uniref:YncE family protein n=1 Tax=Pedobacter segetis TaxID=2793069 RepID=A0ABS1BJU9_9SPHI|nr:YncE family protein [Pedobacter segetis]MBK0383174.1 YncE family protein [Pedobacter segetis]
MKNLSRILTIICPILFSFSAIAQSNFSFQKKISLKGSGGWDYMLLDSQKSRLFVSHDDRVHVIDLNSYKETKTIKNLHGAHHIEIAPTFNKLFISNGDNNTVTVYNYSSLDSITTIAVGNENPDPMCYDDFSKKLYVFCDNNKSVIIDPKNNKITGSIALGGAPDFAFSNHKGFIYNNLEGSDETIIIDVKQQKVIKRFPLPKGAAPTGLALDDQNKRLFAICRGINKMVVLDSEKGTMIMQFPIGGNDDGIHFDKDRKLIFCSAGAGKVIVIKQLSKDNYVVSKQFNTHFGAKTMEYNKSKNELYFSAADRVKNSDKLSPDNFGVYVFKITDK